MSVIGLAPLPTLILLALGALTYVASGTPTAPDPEHLESDPDRARRSSSPTTPST